MPELRARAMRAIEESRQLQLERRIVGREYSRRLIGLKLAILESAMARVEAKAHRDNRENTMIDGQHVSKTIISMGHNELAGGSIQCRRETP